MTGAPSGSMTVRAWPVACATLLALCATGGATGQALELKERPAAASLLCEPRTATPTCRLEDPDEVDRLVNAATQAMILGDLPLANEFLGQALELEPCAAEAAYLRGRIVAQTERLDAATEWFCRYLALEPQGSSAPEADRRLEQAVQDGAASSLLARFSAGVSRFEAGDLARAEELFTSVFDRHPVPEALYNRALVRLALDRTAGARSDLRRYLELRPASVDRTAVEEALAALAAERSSKSPAAALALGALLPGAGQYYTGRPLFGLGVTAFVGSVVAGGYLYRQTTIQCRTSTTSGECPPDDIVSRETERPLLVPAVAVGAGIMLATAIEAAFHTGGDRPALSVPVGGVGTLTFGAAPRVALSTGALDLHLISLEH